MDILHQLEKQLVVSCQALEHEPLHSAKIMGRMARAAEEGGAKGIRANSIQDIKEIKQQVNVPIIGIIKREYTGSDVYITPTLREVKELLAVGVDMIALDATERKRPNNERLEYIVKHVKNNHSDVALMADVSTIAEAIKAEKIGFDCISTTLVGYTEYTQGQNITDQDFARLKDMVHAVSRPVVAEGKIDTPQKANEALTNGAHFVVVGSAITRPQIITKTFADAITHNKK